MLSIDVEIHVADRPSDANGFVGVGCWGCFRSHLACLERARQLGASVAVIAEDDVVVSSRFPNRIAAIADELGDLEWSMIYLGYLSESPARRESIELIRPGIGRLAGWEILGAHFYAVHAGALEPLIDNFRQRLEPGGHRIPADGVLNEFRRDNALDTLVCVPNLAHQAPSPSGIMVHDRGLRSTMLERPSMQQLVEGIKRTGWNCMALLPPALHARAWNVRQRLLRLL